MRRILAVCFLLALCAGAAAGLGLLGWLPFDVAAWKDELAPTPPDAAARAKTESATKAAFAPGSLPKFDVARIEPSGSSVFAGRAKPEEIVTVTENGNVVGTVKADSNGEWALITDHSFSSPAPTLAVTSRPAKPGEVVAGSTALASKEPSGTEKAPVADGTATRAPAPREKQLLRDLEHLVETARKEAQEPAATDTKQAAPAADKKEVAEASTPRIPEAPTPSLHTIPVPITFVYNEAEFTGDGRRAAELLLEYLKLKHFKSISLSGHADERGSDPYNMELSERRLDTVAQFLKAGGFDGTLDLVPKGKREPFEGVDRTRLSQEEVYQLDRRVELHLTQ